MPQNLCYTIFLASSYNAGATKSKEECPDVTAGRYNNMEKIWNKKFVLLFITNLLMMATFYAAVPIIPIYCQQLGITGSKIGIVLTAMSVTTVLFRPFAGYILDNFNRYKDYMLFLALFCLPFLGFVLFPFFGALVVIRLYMGIVYSVCGSATMTLAGDVLPPWKVGKGVNRLRSPYLSAWQRAHSLVYRYRII